MPTIFDTLPVKRLPAARIIDKTAGATVLVGGDDETKAWVKGFYRRHPKFNRYSGIKVNRVLDVTGPGGHPEASVQRGIIHLYPKFWVLDPDIKDFVFAHEIGHVVESHFSLVTAADAVGADLWGDREPLPFGQSNMDEAFADSFASYFMDGDVQRRYPGWARLVEAALATVKTAKLDHAEKERREDERLIQKGTKYKPPRDDLRRKRVKDTDTSDRDPDKEQDQKDRSKNYKDAAVRVALLHVARRVASRYKRAKSDRERFLEEEGDKTVKHPDTGNDVKVSTLFGSREEKDPKGFRFGQELYYKWKKKSKENQKSEDPESGTDKIEIPTENLATLADAMNEASGKKIDKAYKALVEAHPHSKKDLDALRAAYDKANSDLGKAAASGNIDAAEEAKKRRSEAIDAVRNFGKVESEDPESKPEPEDPESKPESVKQPFKNKLDPSANGNLVPDLDLWDLDGDSFEAKAIDGDTAILVDDALELDTSGDSDDAKIKSVIKQLRIANPKLDVKAKTQAIQRQIKAVKSGNYDQPYMVRDTEGRLMILNGEDTVFAARILGVPVDVQEVAYTDKDGNPAAFSTEAVKDSATLKQLSQTLKQYKGITPGDWAEDDEKADFVRAYREAQEKLDPEQLIENLGKVSEILERAGGYDEDDAPSMKERGFAAAVLEAQSRALGGEGAEKAIREKAKGLLAGHDFNKSDSHREVSEKVSNLPAIGQRQFNKALEGQMAQTFEDANKGLKDQKAEAAFAQRVAEAKTFFSNEDSGPIDPEVAAKHAAVLIADHKLNDPMTRFQVPTGPDALIPDAGVDPSDVAIEDEDHALEAYSNITKSKMDVKAAENMAETLKKKLLGLPEGSPAHRKANAAYNALRLYHISRTKPGEEIEGVHQGFANAMRAAHAAGMEKIFLETANEVGMNEAQLLDEISKKVARVYKTVPQHDLHLYLDENSPLKEVAKSAFEEAHAPGVAKYMRDLLEAELSASFRFGDIADPSTDQDIAQVHADVSRITGKRGWANKNSLEELWARISKLWRKRRNPSPSRVASRFVLGGRFPITGNY